MLPLILSILLVILSATTAAAGSLFAIAVTPAPVLNRPDFSAVFGGKDGKTLLKDTCGQLRAVEFVALPGTVFTVEQKIESPAGVIYRVTTNDYPYPVPGGYFVDARSVKVEQQRPAERARKLPAKEQILANMKMKVGTRYIWGGNVAAGIAELADWYPPAGQVDRALWQLAGLDCSGLLYEATGGYTPRNTSSLLNYGRPVAVAGKTVAELAALLQPLDLIVWPGHVLIVLDNRRIIESRSDCDRPLEGVRIRPLGTALKEIMKKRKPVNNIGKGAGEFVVRRWYE
jgi:cell wall-associated NlpC family hydrolase